MKLSEFVLIETCLQNAYDAIMDGYESTDTSVCDENWEIRTEVHEWNKRYNHLINELQSLKDEMIFTFKIEDEEEEKKEVAK